MQKAARFVQSIPQPVSVYQIVRVIEETSITIMSTLNNMNRHSGYVDSRASRHIVFKKEYQQPFSVVREIVFSIVVLSKTIVKNSSLAPY